MNDILYKATNLMNKNEIDHHESDLYLKVTDISRKLISEYEFIENVTIFKSDIDGQNWYDIPFSWYDIEAYREYKKFKLQWLIDHGYVLEDVISVMQELYEEGDHYDNKGSSPLSLFKNFEQSYGFNGAVYPCFDEWYDNDYKNK